VLRVKRKGENGASFGGSRRIYERKALGTKGEENEIKRGTRNRGCHGAPERPLGWMRRGGDARQCGRWVVWRTRGSGVWTPGGGEEGGRDSAEILAHCATGIEVVETGGDVFLGERGGKREEGQCHRVGGSATETGKLAGGETWGRGGCVGKEGAEKSGIDGGGIDLLGGMEGGGIIAEAEKGGRGSRRKCIGGVEKSRTITVGRGAGFLRREGTMGGGKGGAGDDERWDGRGWRLGS